MKHIFLEKKDNIVHVDIIQQEPSWKPSQTCCRCGNIATRYHRDCSVWDVINGLATYFFCEKCQHNSPDEHDWTEPTNDGVA